MSNNYDTLSYIVGERDSYFVTPCDKNNYNTKSNNQNGQLDNATKGGELSIEESLVRVASLPGRLALL